MRWSTAAAFLLGPDAGFITGTDVLLDGGVSAALRGGPVTAGDVTPRAHLHICVSSPLDPAPVRCEASHVTGQHVRPQVNTELASAYARGFRPDVVVLCRAVQRCVFPTETGI
jgi:hypothetical protein